MSQINDALKRAKQSQSPNPPGGIPPLSPIEPAPAGRSRWIFICALLLFIAAVCFFAGPLACDHKASPPPATNAPVAVTPPPPPPPPVTNTAPAPAPLPKVQGIVYDATHPMAIVNGKSVQPNDRVGDYRVVTIARDRVTFQKRDGSTLSVMVGK